MRRLPQKPFTEKEWQHRLITRHSPSLHTRHTLREAEDVLCLSWRVPARTGCTDAVGVAGVPSPAQQRLDVLHNGAVALSMPLQGTVQAGVPVVPVVYHPECEELSKELGLKPTAVPAAPKGGITVGLVNDHAMATVQWYANEAQDLTMRTATREREVLTVEDRLVAALFGKAG